MTKTCEPGFDVAVLLVTWVFDSSFDLFIFLDFVTVCIQVLVVFRLSKSWILGLSTPLMAQIFHVSEHNF